MRTDGHVFVGIALLERIFLIWSQLQNLRNQIEHPSADKLYNLLRKTRPQETAPSTFKIQKHLKQQCDACQRIELALV